MIAIVSGLAFFLDDTSEIKVIGLPLPVVLWSFIGGVGATVYTFVGTQKHLQTEPIRIDWQVPLAFLSGKKEIKSGQK